MLLDQLGNNVALADFYVARLRNLRSLNPKQNIDEVMAVQLPGGFGSIFRPPTFATPAYWVGGNNDRRVVLIDGVSNLEQATGLINGYDHGTGPLGTIGFNPWLEAASLLVARDAISGFLRAPEHLDLVGYSAGGAIAMDVKTRLLIGGSVIKSRVITFGSPRPGSTAYAQRLSGSSIARWMCDNDPIPLVPPRITDVPLLLLLQAARTMVRWGSFVQPHGGISLDAAGNATPSILPFLASVDSGAALASWFLGQENSANNPHALTSYQARLNLAVLASHSPSTQNKREGPTEAPGDTSRGHTTQRQREVMDLISNAGKTQNASFSVVPDQVLFQAVRIDRIWAVEFGGKIICWAPIEKRARHIARAGNDFLRSLPKQAIVDPVALTDQLTAFLAAAVNPLGDFHPPIRIGL